MRKLLTFGLLAGIVILVVLIVRLLLNSPEPQVVTEVPSVIENNGGSVPTNGTSSNTYALPVGSSTIQVKNFLLASDIKPDPSNPGYYHFVDSLNLGYSVQYIAQTGHFTVTLQAEPFAENRLRAESDIRLRTGLTNTQLCNDLSYTVAVPAFVNVELSGIDYRFSFCPDAQEL